MGDGGYLILGLTCCAAVGGWRLGLPRVAAFTVGFLLGLAASAELAPLASHWIISDYKIHPYAGSAQERFIAAGVVQLVVTLGLAGLGGVIFQCLHAFVRLRQCCSPVSSLRISFYNSPHS